MILIGTTAGLRALDGSGKELLHELHEHSVGHIAWGHGGRVVAIVDQHRIVGRSDPARTPAEKVWTDLGELPEDTIGNCLVQVRERLFIGAADARLFALDDMEGDRPERLGSFDAIETRGTWDTPWGGPPDVRSLAVIEDGGRPAIYADIHVGGIVRSFDGGETWSQATGSLHRDVHQVGTHPALPDTVFAATQQGFFRSDDRGDAWYQALDAFRPRNYQRAVVADCEDPDLLLCTASLGPHPRGKTGCEGMIFRSTDGGREWAPAHQGLPAHFHDNINTHMVAASRTRSGLFAFHDDSEGRLFLSNDGAESWHKMAEVPGAQSVLVA